MYDMGAEFRVAVEYKENADEQKESISKIAKVLLRWRELHHLDPAVNNE